MEQPKTSIALTAPRITLEGWRIAKIDADGVWHISINEVLKVNLIPYAMAQIIFAALNEDAAAAGVKLTWGPGRTEGDKSDRLHIILNRFTERR